MMYRFFHVSNDKLPPLLSGNYSNFRPFKRALTIHPLKNPDDMYRLHRYYLSTRSRVKHKKVPRKLIRKQENKTNLTRHTRVNTKTNKKSKTPQKTNQSTGIKKGDKKMNVVKKKNKQQGKNIISKSAKHQRLKNNDKKNKT